MTLKPSVQETTKQVRLRWASFGAYSTLIAIVSLSPDSDMPDLRFLHADKVAHFGMYFVHLLLLARAMGLRTKPLSMAGVACITSVSYGLLMEYGQLLLSSSGRSFSWGDAVANAAGALVGIGLLIKRRHLPLSIANVEVL